MATFKGTAGDDNLTGTSGDDRFDLTKGGNDTASGGDGNDKFNMGATLNAADRIDGGNGTDAINLKGDYGAGLVLDAATIVNIERLNVLAGFNYDLTMNDGNVAAGQRLTVNAGALKSGNHLVFDGSAETDGSYAVTGGAGNDTLAGGALRDVFNLGKGGNDVVHAGSGNDTITMNGGLTAADQIDGGAGNDVMSLNGAYTGVNAVTLSASTMTNVETLQFLAGHNYVLTTNDANVAAGTTLTVDASALVSNNALTFNGAAETDGSFAFIGGAGNDVLTGGNGGNTFDLTLGGHDTANGGLGVNVFNLGAAFDTSDRINGAAGGSNTLILDGAYSGLSVNNTMAANIQTLEIQGSNTLSLIWRASPALTLDASAAGGALTFDAATMGNALHFIGGALNAQITAGAANDTFDAGSLVDSFMGGGGNDVFNFGANLTAADSIDGGSGSNTLTLNGDYSAGLTFGAATMVNIQTLTLANGHDYNLTTDDANLAASQILSVNASALSASRHLIFNGQAETNGSFAVTGGAGADTITGGAQADTFDLSRGGNDTVHAGSGNDIITLGATLTAADAIDGGAGSDTLTLNGDYSGGVVFTASTIANIETLQLASGHSYNLTANNANVASGQTMTVDASALGAANALTFNGAAETDGSFAFIGGAGNDVLTGGNGGNTFDLTHGGSDAANGGQGANIFNLGAAFDNGDRINGAIGANNTLILNGAYFSLDVTNAMAANIQTVAIQGTNTTSIIWQQAATAPMTLDASAAGGSLTFDYSAVNASLHFIGGALNTHITGGSAADTFDAGTATDIFAGGQGDDTFNFAGSLTASDQVDGGIGNDTLTLNGDYSAGLAFGATTMVNVEALTLAAGHDYNLTINNATVASGQTLSVDASALGAANHLTFNAGAESDGFLAITGGAGGDTITFAGNLVAADHVDGGAGSDTLLLNGDYSTGLVFGAATIVNVETLTLAAGHSYNLTASDTTVAAGQTMTVNAGALSASDALTFNAAAETDGFFSITGGAGSDIVTFAGNFSASDHVDGGAGSDTLVLNGDYSAGLTFGATMMANVETLTLAAGHSYNLATGDANVASGQTLAVNASALGAANSLIFNGAAETDGFFSITGGAGSDTVTFAGNFSASDHVDGGAGSDTLVLNGDYSAGLSLGATMMVNVETLQLGAGHSYNLTTSDANIAPGQTLAVNASALGAADSLALNASAETDGLLSVTAGAGGDTITFGGGFAAADHIDGGAGSDTLILNGDYSAGLTFGATIMVNVETLTLAAGHDYNLTTNNANVAAGQTLTVDASALGAANHLTFNGAAETDGFFSITGGAGGDTVTFGGNFAASDHVDGGAGSDTLVLNGDYSAGLSLGATMMVNVESLHLAAGHSYNLTTSDANVASGQTLAVDASALAAGSSLTFNGAAETDGFFAVTGGAAGDVFSFAGNFTASDHIDGGAGNDALILNGDYSAGLTFAASTMVNVETLTLAAGHDYNLTTNNATVAAGQTLTVDASALAASNHLTLNASAETDGFLTILGGAGNDTATFGSGFAAADHVDGGAGSDVLALNGDYSAGFTFGASTIANIETLQLAAGHSYNFTTNDANVASGQSLTVDASALGGADSLIFNGAAETDGSFTLIGGAGSDTLTGGALADSFDLSKGGGDTAHGGSGNDAFLMGAALAAADSIDGGAGSDTLVLNGDYSGGVTLGAATLTSLETMQFTAGHVYNLTTNDGNVASGTTLAVDGSGLGAADSLIFNGAAETNGTFALAGGAGNDTLTGGALADTISLTQGGNDTAHGGGGSDTFFLAAALNAADSIDGGAGNDLLIVDGDYSAGVVFGAATIASIETMQLSGGHDYNFTTGGNVASAQTLTVDGSLLGAGDSLVFNGAAEVNGSLTFIGGTGDATLTGGAQADNFNLTQGGNDTVQGGGGNDSFLLNTAFTTADSIDGGAGSDTLSLNGDYSVGMTFTAATIANIETLSLASGHSYNFTTADGNVTPGGAMTVDGSALVGANTLTFNGAAETQGSFAFLAGAGNDVLSGGAQADSFTMTAGGIDTVHGGGGNDTFNFGATLTAADTIDGGAGTDTVSISGNGFGNFTFGATTMTNVDTLILASNNNYGLTTDDATIAAGQRLTVDATALTVGQRLTLNAQAESDGYFTILGGNTGWVTANFGGNFVAADQFIGTNSGADILNLNGDYSAGLVFNANTIVGVDQILLFAGHSYNFTTNDANVVAGHTLFVTGSNLVAGNSLTFDGSAETNGFFQISGGAGDDTIVMGAAFNLNDFFNAGAGTDTLSLNGNYSAGMTLTGTNIANFEVLQLGGGHSYNFTTNDGTVASGATLTVDASALGAGDTLTINGNAETNGNFAFIAGAGNDVLTAGAGNNSFDLTRGGNDTVHAGGGNDTFTLGAALTAVDTLDGGTGTDGIVLNGDYSSGVTLAATTLTNFESIAFSAGHSYNVTTNDATVASAVVFTVDGSALGASDNLVFNGAAETNATFTFAAGAGNDTLTGGALADTFNFGSRLTAADSINGGGGNDTVSINGDYSAGFTFGATTMINVETLTLAAGHSYNLTTNDATVASGARLSVDASLLGAGNTLTFDGSAETNGIFSVNGGAGNDVIMVGSGLKSSSVINGGAGTDTLVLNGDYSAGLVFANTTMTGIEVMKFAAGHSYNITIEDANVAAGATVTVDGSALGASDSLNFANGDQDGNFVYTGGAGNDHISGGQKTNTFDMTLGGVDSVSGGFGTDTFNFGATLTAADHVDGVGGLGDTLILNGDYSAGITFSATTIVNIDVVTLTAGHSYSITVNEANLASGASMTYNGLALGASDTLIFNGAAETDGSLTIKGGAGDDVITTGGFATIDISAGGNDTVHGGSGADTINCGGALTNSDSIDGGGIGSRNTVNLHGDYSSGLVLAASTLVNINGMSFSAGFNYNITTPDALDQAATVFTVDASTLGAANSLTFDGSAETDGFFSFVGGAGNDVLTGGMGNDLFDLSKGGSDTATGGIGNETFTMGGALNSADKIDGGAGNDTVTLEGDYSAGLVLNATTLVNIETLTISDNAHNYNITLDQGTVAAGATMTINAAILGLNNTFTLDTTAETDGKLLISGGNGNDHIIVGTGLMVAGTQINCGFNYDILEFNGDFSSGFTLGAATATNFEEMDFDAGHTYNLTTNDATVASGVAFKVDGSRLGVSDSLIFNGSAETDGTFSMFGGAGNDTLTGSSGTDTFDITLGGNDTVHGNGGADTVLAGSALTADDSINGASKVVLNGDYSGGLVLSATTLVNVGVLQLTAGHIYNITTGSFFAGTIDGSALGASDTLIFNGGGEITGGFNITAGAGNDVLTGGVQGDTFDLTKGGIDTVHGGDGNDTFTFAGTFTDADTVDAGAGSDTLSFTNSYVGTLATVTSVETLNLGTGNTGAYNITVGDAFVAAGTTLVVTASSAASLKFDGSAETDGAFNFTGTQGNDILTGGTGNDTFNMGQFGTDVVRGGGGDDVINMGSNFGPSDQIDGGAGNDSVTLTFANGPFTLSGLTITNVEMLILKNNGSAKYVFTMDDGNVAAGATMTIDATATLNTDTVSINASAETDGHYHFIAGSFTETFVGGAQADTFDLTKNGADTVTGGGGADSFTAGATAIDTFVYTAVSNSTSTGYDTIAQLNFSHARFNVSSIGAVTGVDTAVTTGALSTATFDSDLASDVGAGQLAAHHAMLFTADSGTLAGQTFMIVDENGVAGYQAGADLVIDVTGAGGLTMSNFI